MIASPLGLRLVTGILTIFLKFRQIKIFFHYVKNKKEQKEILKEIIHFYLQ